MTGDTTEGLVRALDPRTLPRRHQIGLLGLLVLAVAPAGAPTILVLKLTTALFFTVFVMTWDVVSGYTGQISFGHALFFGVGAYASALANVYLGLPPELTIFLGAGFAALAGIVVGLPALRLRGPYLALVTLVAPLILLRFIVLASPWTGGETGLVGASKTPSGAFGAQDIFPDPIGNYYLAFGVFIFALVLFLAVTRSDAGRVFTAIREDEDAVAAAGLNPSKFKLFAFVLSGSVGGLAGAAFVHSTAGTVSPAQILSVTLSIEVIVATILGGTGTITGSAVGGLFLFFLRDRLRQVETVIPVLNTPVSDLDLLIFSVVTLAFLFFLPEGIVPRLVRKSRELEARLRGDGPGPTTDDERSPMESILSRLRSELRELFGGERR